VNIPDGKAASEIGVAEIMSVGREAKLSLRELANAQDESQALLERLRGVGVLEQRFDGLLPAPHLALPARSLGVVADGLAAGEKDAQREEEKLSAEPEGEWRIEN
jgi:hypothetical protein